ncbi:hypothetical protein [Actinokineospora globicatena]|uniref:DNA-binding phage zinc finger domain-containing protein n=1 Tax=Actinokineospora globicatena TaxID=103729 RepID=A0A9W6QNN3_9PSEU|nr:hypothetical protein [Actinokineospora globicatena]GLW91809.1 hypothetical protein Aglo03_26250 [Actinokineospora globicatena]
MNDVEVGRLLTVVKMLDQRAPQPDKAGMLRKLWQGLLAHVPFAAAKQATEEWYRSDRYRETRETITPADIAGWWRSRRREPVAPRGMIGAAAREAAAVLAEEAATRGMALWTHLRTGLELEAAVCEVEARRLVTSVPCPWEPCRAGVGQPCTDWKGRPLAKTAGGAHAGRVQAVIGGSTQV